MHTMHCCIQLLLHGTPFLDNFLPQNSLGLGIYKCECMCICCVNGKFQNSSIGHLENLSSCFSLEYSFATRTCKCLCSFFLGFIFIFHYFLCSCINVWVIITKITLDIYPWHKQTGKPNLTWLSKNDICSSIPTNMNFICQTIYYELVCYPLILLSASLYITISNIHQGIILFKNNIFAKNQILNNNHNKYKFKMKKQI